MSAKGVKHLGDRLGHVTLEGLTFNLGAGLRECRNGCSGLWSRGVTAVRLHAVLHVYHALFRDTYNAARALKTGESTLYYRAALVEYHRGIDIVFLKVIYDMSCAETVDLLTSGEREVNVVFGHKALTDKVVGREERTCKPAGERRD